MIRIRLDYNFWFCNTFVVSDSYEALETFVQITMLERKNVTRRNFFRCYGKFKAPFSNWSVCLNDDLCEWPHVRLHKGMKWMGGRSVVGHQSNLLFAFRMQECQKPEKCLVQALWKRWNTGTAFQGQIFEGSKIANEKRKFTHTLIKYIAEEDFFKNLFRLALALLCAPVRGSKCKETPPSHPERGYYLFVIHPDLCLEKSGLSVRGLRLSKRGPASQQDCQPVSESSGHSVRGPAYILRGPASLLEALPLYDRPSLSVSGPSSLWEVIPLGLSVALLFLWEERPLCERHGLTVKPWSLTDIISHRKCIASLC